MSKIRLILADDHRIVRDGLRALLSDEFDIVGEAGDGREAIRLVRDLDADVLLIDISMPGLNGIDAVTKITSLSTDCKVICLSMHQSSEYVTRMLGAGALGYLHKDTASQELSEAIESVASGQVFLGKGVADDLVADYQRLRQAEKAEPELTIREREVLQLIAEGNKTRDIADRLSISTKTVETHRSQIMKKLKIDGIARLTRYAIQRGIVDLDT